MIHRDLLHVLAPGAAGALACGIFGVVGLVAPHLLDWTSPPLLVKIALGLLAGMPLLYIAAFRLHLKSRWVYRNTKPRTATVTVKIDESTDSTSYYVLLRFQENSEQTEEIPVYPPRWDVSAIKPETPANVFIDPRSSKPLVFEFEGKRLWSMAL